MMKQKKVSDPHWARRVGWSGGGLRRRVLSAPRFIVTNLVLDEILHTPACAIDLFVEDFCPAWHGRRPCGACSSWLRHSWSGRSAACSTRAPTAPPDVATGRALVKNRKDARRGERALRLRPASFIASVTGLRGGTSSPSTLFQSRSGSGSIRGLMAMNSPQAKT
jgi:hypothetical protein